MNLNISDCIKQVQNQYKSNNIIFENSYLKEAEKYYESVLQLPKFANLNEEEKRNAAFSVIKKVSEIAVKLALESNKTNIDSGLFHKALAAYNRKYKYYGGIGKPEQSKEYGGPIIDPTNGSGDNPPVE